jgi:hypothetical protein
MLTRKEGAVKKENNNLARTKKDRLLKGRIGCHFVRVQVTYRKT